jgi:hypothetical protein
MKVYVRYCTGCCPNRNPFEWSLKRFLPRNLGEVEDKRCQLFEPEGQVLKSPGASLRFIKNVLDKAKRDLGNSPLHREHEKSSRRPGGSSSPEPLAKTVKIKAILCIRIIW